MNPQVPVKVLVLVLSPSPYIPVWGQYIPFQDTQMLEDSPLDHHINAPVFYIPLVEYMQLLVLMNSSV